MVVSFFDQFNIIVWGGVSNFFLMVMLVFIMFYIFIVGSGKSVVVTKRKVLGNRFLSSIKEMVSDSFLGGERYFPFILGLFVFILIVNLMGLCPYVFTPTAHVGLTVGLSFTIVLALTIRGWIKYGFNFFSLFMPKGAPLSIFFGLIIIESISYLIRIISLGVRLAANITAGHLLLAIISGFVWDLVVDGGVVLGFLGGFVLLFVVLLEIGMAFIQTYVFCLLTVIYFKDAHEAH